MNEAKYMTKDTKKKERNDNEEKLGWEKEQYVRIVNRRQKQIVSLIVKDEAKESNDEYMRRRQIDILGKQFSLI